MVRTTEYLGRRGGVCAEAPAEELSTLDRARKLFAGLSRSLEGEIERLEAALDADTDKTRAKDLSDLVRITQKTLNTVLAAEVKLMRGAGKAQRGERGEGVIDFAEARAEVARRLARLAG